MRLPADATLIVVGAGQAGPSPPLGAAANRIGANVESLIAAWRREGLPVVHLRIDAAPVAPSDGSATFAGAAGGFTGTALEGLLDASGVTTLVICGVRGALEATARDAAGLGYHIFIPLDACLPPSPSDFDGAGLRLYGAAIIVDTATALAAAATAKSRQRREAQRGREPGA